MRPVFGHVHLSLICIAGMIGGHASRRVQFTAPTQDDPRLFQHDSQTGIAMGSGRGQFHQPKVQPAAGAQFKWRMVPPLRWRLGIGRSGLAGRHSKTEVGRQAFAVQELPLRASGNGSQVFQSTRIERVGCPCTVGLPNGAGGGSARRFSSLRFSCCRWDAEPPAVTHQLASCPASQRYPW